jgi:hypothetical protein
MKFNRYVSYLFPFISNLYVIATHKETSPKYNKIIYPGTHNSYSNLYNPTPLPAPTYKDFILNQQWSIKDQLDKGIRVLDLELNSIFPPTKCPARSSNLKNINCTFLVSHGTAEEAINFDLGYSFLDDIFFEIKDWLLDKHLVYPKQYPITIILNKQDTHIKNEDIQSIFKKTGLDSYVYFYDTEITSTPYFENNWPTIGEMKTAKKPLMIFGMNEEHRMLRYQNWFITPNCNAYNSRHNKPLHWKNPFTNNTICIDQGWDGSELENFNPSKLVIPDVSLYINQSELFALSILFSPRDFSDYPFYFGGNPILQAKVNQYNILYNLTKKANEILAKNNQQVNWILVDFFDTIYEKKTNKWSSNKYDGLINVTNDLNTRPDHHQSSKSSNHL